MNITSGQARIYDDAGTQRLAVPWAIKEGDTVLHEGSQSFELGTGPEEIKDFLAHTLQVFKDDSARYEETKERQAKLDASASVIEEISNITL